MKNNYLVKVWGKWACFTSPVISPSRVSYLVMPPTAANGLLRSICGKLEMGYRINNIYICNPIKTLNFTTNEINHFGNGFQAIYAEDRHTQRTNYILKDVEYIIDCSILCNNNQLAKYHNMFMYRIKRGKCFRQPYFGLKEYVANFELINKLPPIEPINLYLGRIPCSVTFINNRGIYQFKEARIENGVLRI